MASGSIIDLFATVSIETIEALATATGYNVVAYITEASTSLSAPTFYATAAAAAADGDLDATDKAGIAAMFAAGGTGFGGVYVSNYDTTTEDASDALDALVAAGYVPGWHYMYAVAAERVDAEIDFLADWISTLPTSTADMLLGYGQLSTSSIKSGTVPATTGASDGAAKMQICYDDRDASYTVERYVATIAGNSKPVSATDANAGNRPPLAFIGCPTSVGQMTADLTQPELTAATGRGASQARCVAHGKVTPTSAVDDRIWAKGHTLGATLAESEYTTARIKLKILSEVATLLRTRSRSPDNIPLLDRPQDEKVVRGLLSRNLALFRDFGYLKRRPVADEALGFPALPEGYQITISTASGVMSVALKLSYGSEIRDLPLGAIAYVG